VTSEQSAARPTPLGGEAAGEKKRRNRELVTVTGWVLQRVMIQRVRGVWTWVGRCLNKVVFSRALRPGTSVCWSVARWSSQSRCAEAQSVATVASSIDEEAVRAMG